MGKAATIKNALAKNAGDLARLLLGTENRSLSSRIEMRFGRKGSLSVVTDGGAVAGVVGIRCGALSGNMKVQFQAARSIG